MKNIIFVFVLLSTALFANELQFKDNIRCPTYAWPRTLISHPVALSDNCDDIIVTDLKSGNIIPSQLSTSKNGSNVVTFFSDLPSGADRSYSIKTGKSLQKCHQPVKSNSSGSFIEVDGGSIGIRIPASQNMGIGVPVPGPVYSLRRNSNWIGESKIISPSLSVLAIETTRLEDGELFQIWQVRYHFEKNGVYTAVLKVISGYDFIEFHEEMSSLDKNYNITNEMNWVNFSPEYRYGIASGMYNSMKPWPKINQGVKTSSTQEDPAWSPGVIEDTSKEMWMYLSPYNGNGVRELMPCVSFWNNTDELGVFVLDYKRWQDGEYGIWQPTRRLMTSFRYLDGLLSWSWPIVTGTRVTAINLNSTEKGEAYTESLQSILKKIAPDTKSVGDRFDPQNIKVRYNQLLQQIYGPLNLDKVKNWQLNYPLTAKRPEKLFLAGSVKSADDFISKLFSSVFVFYPIGQNGWPGVNSINHRFVYEWVLDGMMRLSDQMTHEQLIRADALLLLSAHLLTDDAMHPIRNCMAGAPNMAADGWCVPAGISFLYPEHSMAKEWREHYQKYWSLTHTYFTRPATEYSLGGRWTESLGTYNWAHLRPTGVVQIMNFIQDSINRWATPEAVERGRWMVDMLTAPINNPDPYWRQEFKKGKPTPPKDSGELTRHYPAHGAHGSGTTMEPPKIVNTYGYFLRNYDPMISENLTWINTYGFHEEKGGHSHSVSWPSLIKKFTDHNTGTRPEFKSCKYTGHGVVLRAGVGSRDEISIHLDQVDRGPNYRWGNTNNGGSGVIYFYGGGKIWTGHEREDTGDHTANNCEGVTNFGVMKDGSFKGIGHNILERPLIDLGVAQLTTITSRCDESRYSWPAYESRSIMLVGHDYFLIYDKVGTTGSLGRFSWFIAKDQEYPEIAFLKPQGARQDHWREVFTPSAKGFNRDAPGSHLTFVTHKKDSVQLKQMSKKTLPFLSFTDIKQYENKNKLPLGVYEVKTDEYDDIFFRDERDIRYDSDSISFSGQAGVYRKSKNGNEQYALFGKGSIYSKNISLALEEGDCGISIANIHNGISGICYSEKGGVAVITGNAVVGTLYLDGIETAVQQGRFIIPKGRHNWEITNFKAMPMQAKILRTVNFSGGANIFFSESPAAEKYLLEYSTDTAKTFSAIGKFNTSPAVIREFSNGQKLHVRIIAMNTDKIATPSHEYPIYVNDIIPEHPDGLALSLGTNTIEASWGKCLGAENYRLYRRIVGEPSWNVVYKGNETNFIDRASGVVRHTMLPGKEDNIPYRGIVYEYAVTTVNGNGESKKSEIVTSSPTSWLNWMPNTDSPGFRRDTEYWKPPYVSAREEVPKKY